MQRLSKPDATFRGAAGPAGFWPPGVSRLRSPSMWCIGLALASIGLWRFSLGSVAVEQMDDLGLVSVLPWSFYAAFGLLLVSFGWLLLSRPSHTPLLLLHTVLLIMMLYGTVVLVEEMPRLHVAWRHAGFTEYIMRRGAIEHSVDAYFDWPVFFALGALVAQIVGWTSPVGLLAWAPLLFGLLYLGPTLMILRAATPDRRVMWLGAWFFYLALWTSYEFYAPQAFNYFIYLAILAILLTWFHAPGAPGERRHSRLGQRLPLPAAWRQRLANDHNNGLPLGPAAISPGQQAGLLMIVAALFAASVSSHMLTPFFITAPVAALVGFQRLWPRGLPALMTVLIGLWLSYMAVSFLSGHMHMVTEGLGQVGENVDANVVERLRGSPGHVVVVSMRMHLSLAVWCLALLGALRRLASGFLDLTFGLIGVVPFTFLALQAYGGEMMLRIYMFALPAAVFFAASTFFVRPRQAVSRLTVLTAGLVSLYLFVAFMVARYGNERMDYFSRQEVEAVDYVYATAPPGSLLVAISENLPWRHQHYETHAYFKLIDLGGVAIRETDIERIEQVLRNPNYGAAFLIITRSQAAYTELFLGWDPGTVGRFEAALLESGEFEVLYQNRDAAIYVVTEDDIQVSRP